MKTSPQPGQQAIQTSPQPGTDCSKPLIHYASCICTIRPEQAQAYARAVAEYGSADLYIEDGELHDDDLFRDLTDFWAALEPMLEY